MRNQQYEKLLLLYACVAALGCFICGFDTSVINGAMPFFTGHFQLNDAMTGWAVSSALLGCIIRAIGVGKPGDIYGRRQMLKISAVMFLVSAIGTGLAPEINSFIVFRFIGGLGLVLGLLRFYHPCISPKLRRQNTGACLL